MKMANGSGLTRTAVSLTHRSLKALRSAEAPSRISDQRCIELAVRIAPNSIKTRDLAYRIRGPQKGRRVSLGRVADMSLERARARAKELTSAARIDRDLVAEEHETPNRSLNTQARSSPVQALTTPMTSGRFGRLWERRSGGKGVFFVVEKVIDGRDMRTQMLDKVRVLNHRRCPLDTLLVEAQVTDENCEVKAAE